MSTSSSRIVHAPSSRLSSTTVQQAMHPGVLACAPDTPLPAVARLMSEHQIHCVAVIGLGESQAGETFSWRFITPTEVFTAALKGDEESATASAMATERIESIESAATLSDAVDEMVQVSTTHLLVVDADSQLPVGVLSTQDIMSVLAGPEPR